MQKFLIIMLFAYGLIRPANGQAQSLQELRWRLHAVQQQSFAELDGLSLRIGSFEEAESFFQSNFAPLSLLGARPDYRIEVNPGLLDRGCPDAALDAVLAHELSHTLDYHQGGRLGLITILWQLVVDPRTYEHQTDLQAIFRGYGPGLIQYREWLYAQLTAEQVMRKRWMYYQPEEISLLLQRLAPLSFRERQTLEARWLAQPPLSPAEILAD